MIELTENGRESEKTGFRAASVNEILIRDGKNDVFYKRWCKLRVKKDNFYRLNLRAINAYDATPYGQRPFVTAYCVDYYKNGVLFEVNPYMRMFLNFWEIKKVLIEDG